MLIAVVIELDDQVKCEADGMDSDEHVAARAAKIGIPQ